VLAQNPYLYPGGSRSSATLKKKKKQQCVDFVLENPIGKNKNPRPDVGPDAFFFF
jgi:hypothetical protein